MTYFFQKSKICVDSTNFKYIFHFSKYQKINMHDLFKEFLCWWKIYIIMSTIKLIV